MLLFSYGFNPGNYCNYANVRFNLEPLINTNKNEGGQYRNIELVPSKILLRLFFTFRMYLKIYVFA